jgi:hypothetical protein
MLSLPDALVVLYSYHETKLFGVYFNHVSWYKYFHLELLHAFFEMPTCIYFESMHRKVSSYMIQNLKPVSISHNDKYNNQ